MTIRLSAPGASPVATEQRSELLERLAAFVQSDLGLDESLRAEVKRRVLDSVGCAMFGADLPHSSALSAALCEPATVGGYAVVGTDQAAPSPIIAALLNGAFASAFEIDDVGSYLHPGASIVGVALAAAQIVPQDGIGVALIDAVAVGYEVSVRISETVGFAAEGIVGWHTPGFHAAIGAAATCARLMSLDADQTLHALAMAADLAGGGLMSARFGTDVKRSHTGRAGQTGLTAALMAGRGMTGVPDVLENERWGYFRAMTHGSKVPDAAAIAETVNGLGRRWRSFPAISYKEYPITAKGIGVINNAREILRDHQISPGEINGITIGLSEMGAGQPANAMPATEPKHVNFSYPYAVAVALAGLAEPLTSPTASPAVWLAGFDDPVIDRLQRLVTVVWDPSIDADNPYSMDSVVTLSTTRGELSSRVAYGDKANPHALRLSEFSAEDLEVKFRNLAGQRVTDARAEAVLSAILDLESMTDVNSLLALTR